MGLPGSCRGDVVRPSGGVTPAGNAMKLLDGFIADPEMPKGHLVVDRGYIPKARANELQIPARLGGYRINSDQPKNVTGFQHQFQSGVVQIDGQFFRTISALHSPLRGPGGRVAQWRDFRGRA